MKTWTFHILTLDALQATHTALGRENADVPPSIWRRPCMRRHFDFDPNLPPPPDVKVRTYRLLYAEPRFNVAFYEEVE